MFSKIKKIFIYALIVYAIIGFIILPLILKPQLIKLLETNTNAKVTLSSVSVNPFLFTLELSGVHVSNLNATPLLSFKSLVVDVDMYSLFYKAVHIHDVELNSLVVNFVRNKDKSINLLSILKENNTTQETKQKSQSFSMPRIILDKMVLTNAKINLTDNTIKEPFHFHLKKIGLKIINIDTAEKNNANGKVRLFASLSNGGFIDFRAKIKNYEPLVSNGSLDFTANKIYTEWKYIKDMLNIEVANGTVSLHSEYRLNLGDLNATKIEKTNISIKDLRLKPKEKPYDILNLKTLDIKNLTFYPFKRSLVVPEISINKLDIKVKRQADKMIDWMKYVKIKLPKVSKIQNNDTQQGAAFYTVIKKISLAEGRVTFTDEALKRVTRSTVDNININLYDVSTEKKKWFKYDTNFQINSKGLVTAQGKVRQSPLKQEGTLKIKNISLKEINPYIEEKSYLALKDGRLSATAKIIYEKSPKLPDLRVNGSLYLNSLFVNDTHNDSLLFSLNELGLKSYTLELMPNRFYVDTIGINSFYVDAKIDKNKRLNFSKLLKKATRNKKLKKEKVKTTSKPFPVKIAKVIVKLGSAKFQDFSIPLKFKTNIHNLNGVIYSLSNIPNEISLINLDGDIDKYGSTKLKGKVNSSNPKAYLDIDFNFKNLALNSLSGYSAEFAGYKIDSGKLFLDLGYDIVDSKLQGKNKIIIKKIKLGDEVDDENVTVLPLGFVVGLLEDDKGIIDIDMPVTGNLDKPNFKYGKLIWNTFTNLITRAVTSPFRFLGSMLGMDSKDLEYVAFESGKSRISPMQREKLDKLAIILSKRPKLVLSVLGTYNKKIDKTALQTEKLIALVLKKSGLKNKKEHESAMTVSMLEEIYQEKNKDKKITILKKELAEKYKNKKFYTMYRKALIKLCVTSMSVSKKELIKLANKRADGVITYFSDEKGIALERLKKGKIKDEKSKGKFVKVHLKVNVVMKKR
jgi:uncharacterized protein with PQ loop repeat